MIYRIKNGIFSNTLLIFLLALFIRIVWILLSQFPPIFDWIIYHNIALSLAKGEGFSLLGKPTAFFLPGYPFILSILYRLFGACTLVANLLNAVLGAFIAVLTYYIGKLFFSNSVPVLSGIMVAIFPALVFQAGTIFSDTLFSCLFLVIFIILAKCIIKQEIRFSDSIVAGVLIAIALLVKSTLVLFPIGLPCLSKKLYTKQTVLMIGLIILIPLLTSLLWIARNSQVMGSPVFTTNIGLNFYIGNNKNANGGLIDFSNDNELAHLFWTGECQFNEVEKDREYFKKALCDIQINLKQIPLLMMKKIIHFIYWGDNLFYIEIFKNRMSYLKIIRAYFETIGSIIYLVVLCFSLLWFIVIKHPLKPFISWCFIYFVIYHLIFFGIPRFNLPLIPLMVLLSFDFLDKKVVV